MWHHPAVLCRSVLFVGFTLLSRILLPLFMQCFSWSIRVKEPTCKQCEVQTAPKFIAPPENSGSCSTQCHHLAKAAFPVQLVLSLMFSTWFLSFLYITPSYSLFFHGTWLDQLIIWCKLSYFHGNTWRISIQSWSTAFLFDKKPTYWYCPPIVVNWIYIRKNIKV